MKKLLIIIFVIILISGGGFYYYKKSQKVPEYITAQVTRGSLKQTVEATGHIESAESIDLNFKTTGRIINIFVKVGDYVSQGQKLAELESQSLQSQIDDAQARLKQAQADCDKLLAGSSAQEIKIAKDIVAQENQDLITAKNSLANLKSKSDLEILNLKETAIIILKNEIIVAQNAMDEIDNTLNDPDAEDTLSIKNPASLIQAKLSQQEANENVAQIEDTINLIIADSTDNEVFKALDDLKNSLNKITTALSNILDVLVNTSISSDLSEDELDTLKSNIKTQQTQINSAKTNVQTAKSNWTNKISYYKDQVISNEDAVKKAEKDLRLAQSQLELKTAPVRQFEIDVSQAKIAQAQANLKLALANLNETIITAPVNGTIIKKNYEPGEQSSLTTPTLTMISQSDLQIEVDIPESDIAKVRLGQKTEITLDAFGSDKIFNGSVSFIDPAETVVQDVIYYQVKVQFNHLRDDIPCLAQVDRQPFDKTQGCLEQVDGQQVQALLPGMTANVTILTYQKDNVLILPFRAVKTKNGQKYVEILQPDLTKKSGKILVERIVITGLRGDDGLEVVSGLEESEEVVVFVKE